MRASGILAGGGLLVASWVAWFATSGPGEAPAFAPPARDRPAHTVPLPRPAPSVAAIPVYAEVAGGPALRDVLARNRVPGRLAVVLTTQPPGLAVLAVDRDLRGLVAEARGLAALRDPGLVAALAVPPEGGWVMLVLDGLLLGTRRVTPEHSLVRFDLRAEELSELLGLAPIS